MEFSLQHIFDNQMLSSAPDKSFVSFEEKRKCLNFVFWSTWQALKSGKRTLVIVSGDEDLEYLNYFISRYEIQNLSLVIDGESEMQPSYVIDRFNRNENLFCDPAQVDIAREKLEIRLGSFKENLEYYHEPCLGKLNLIEAARRVAESPYPELRAVLYPGISLPEYRQKKQLIKKASDIYKAEFRYNDSFRIFDDSIFREYDSTSILGVLKELSEDVEKLLEDFESFYQGIHRVLQKEKLSEIDQLKQDFRKLERIVESRKKLFDDTESQKLSFLSKSLLAQLSSEETFKNNPKDDLALINTLLQEKVNEINEAVREELKSSLHRLNKNNSEHDPSDIFNRCNQLMSRINSSGIFKDNCECFCFSFNAYRNWAKEIMQLLDKAVYLLSFETDMLDWHILMNSLKASDKTLITELLDNRTDWLACFEDAYLSSFVKARTAEVDSLNRMHDDILDLWQNFQASAYQEITSVYNSRRNAGESKMTKADNWMELLDQQADKLFVRFPLIMVKAGFYEDNKEALIEHADHVVSVNIDEVAFEPLDNKSLLITAFNEQLIRKVLPKVKRINNCEIEHIPGIAFNINRSAHFLNQSERQNLSLYLAYGIRHFNSDFRIFQTKEHSIISLVRYDRNNRLIEAMEGTGVKEIFSNDHRQNLLPGIFNDKSTQVIIILEDQLLNPDRKDSLMQQKLFLEELKTAGFEVLNIDNYKLFSNGTDALEAMITKAISKKAEALVVK